MDTGSKEGKEAKETKEGKEARKTGEAGEAKATKESKEGKGNKEVEETREAKEAKEKSPRNRRQEIIMAALGIFSEKGFHYARIEEVALAAGIGKGTVYEYFRSKEELLGAAVRYEMEDMARQVKSKVDQAATVKDKLKAMVETVMVRHHKGCYLGLNMNPADMGKAMKEFQGIILEQDLLWQEWLKEMIAAGVASGEIRPVDSQLFLGALMGAVIHLLRPWNSVWDNYEPQEAAEQVADFFFAGIRKNGV
jgi:TetR/AcrR family fatty acid metabolism transcriptional regulator